MRQFTRADGVPKRIRIQEGHLFVCKGCCCGRTDKGFPTLPLEEFKIQWKKRGIRRRFHLTVSGCLGPCALANVVLIQFHGQTIWLQSINNADDVSSIYNYVEQMLLAEEYIDPPAAIAARQFQRYGFEISNRTNAPSAVGPESRRTRPLFFLQGSAGRSKKFMEGCANTFPMRVRGNSRRFRQRRVPLLPSTGS